MKLNTKSILFKLWLFFVIFAIFILASLWLLQVVFLKTYYEIIKTNEIKKTAEIVKKNIDSENFIPIINRLSLSNDSSIVITEENGQILYSSNTLRNSILLHISPDTLNESIQTARTSKNKYFITTLNNIFTSKSIINKLKPQKNSIPEIPNQKYIIYTGIVKFSDNTQALLFIDTPLRPIGSTIKILTNQLIYITFIVLLFAMVFSIVISRRISKPILKLEESAASLAKGNFEINFPSCGYEEIDLLANTMNYAAKEISQLDKLRQDLIANVSHDLRTPLTMIKAYAESIQDFPDESHDEEIKIIIDETNHLTNLVNDILNISKYESGNIPLKIISFNITETIKSILYKYENYWSSNGYICNFDYDKDCVVIADKDRIVQVLYNLITNAINYTGEDKKIIIRQIQKDSTLKIEICDTGKGIPTDKLPNIWNRYYKIDKIHKRTNMGTGLGLSIVKNILELHKTNYGVISTVGKG